MKKSTVNSIIYIAVTVVTAVITFLIVTAIRTDAAGDERPTLITVSDRTDTTSETAPPPTISTIPPTTETDYVDAFDKDPDREGPPPRYAQGKPINGLDWRPNNGPHWPGLEPPQP